MTDFLEALFQIIYTAMTLLFESENFFYTLYLFNNCVIVLCLFVWLCQTLTGGGKKNGKN